MTASPFFGGSVLRTLILGYGNRDRQDDGIAWHILTGLKAALGFPNPESIDEDFLSNDDLVLVFQLQLMPEQAEYLSLFERILFVDTHTGAVPEDINWQEISSQFQNSPLTHHMTPGTLISIVETVYNKRPEAALLSVRGFEFEFSQQLSSRTQALVAESLTRIQSWLRRDHTEGK